MFQTNPPRQMSFTPRAPKAGYFKSDFDSTVPAKDTTLGGYIQDTMVKESSIELDPNGTPANAPGAKLDAGKVQAWLFFSGFAHALEDVANVTTVGALKYTENGWVDVPDGKKRYMNAFMRHALEFGKGKVIDDGPKGTGCTHISQMIWNLLAVHELSLRDKNGKADGSL